MTILPAHYTWTVDVYEIQLHREGEGETQITSNSYAPTRFPDAHNATRML